MTFNVRVVSDADWRRWLAERGEAIVSASAALAPGESVRHGLLAWLSATDHKKIGILYLVTSVGFFGIGGLLALAMRAQLARPNEHLFSAHTYPEIFTLHGTAMIFLFIAPFAFGLANYLIPLQIGAPDMAFPRLNAMSYWLYLFGGLTIFSGALTAGGAANAGWTAYAPLSTTQTGQGTGMDLWIIGLIMTSISGILSALNFTTTAFLYRAPGMTMWRLPIFTWEMIATSLLIFMAFPPFATVLFMLLIDRQLGGHFFDPSSGGSPILYQHLFWFFGHPEVYVMALPFFGVVAEIIAVFSGKPFFGYLGMVISAFAIAGLSMGVWAHHMFTTGLVDNPFFSGMSFLIAVPTGVKFVNWIGTMWKGSIRLTTPMLFCIGFLLNFLIGGITGVMLASPPIDFHAEDSYWLVSHFHYTLGGGSMFAIFAAIYFWFPKVFGVKLDERLGKWCFGLSFIGFNVVFLAMFAVGFLGMPRRVVTYPDLPWWGMLNTIESLGSLILAAGVIVLIADIFFSIHKHEPVPADPWGGYSLEWATTSPPPEHNFTSLPPIRSERPVWDLRHERERVNE